MRQYKSRFTIHRGCLVVGGHRRGSAAAETFQHGGSTTTIEQSGGSGASRSQVIRDKDGQTIITETGTVRISRFNAVLARLSRRQRGASTRGG